MVDHRPARSAAAPPAAAETSAPVSPIEQLSARERDILRAIARGASNKEIARELGIAETTAAATAHGLR